MHVFDDLTINKQAIYSIANLSSPLSQNPPGSWRCAAILCFNLPQAFTCYDLTQQGSATGPSSGWC
jgi:hypothetical protein